MVSVEETMVRTACEHALFVTGAPALLMVSGGSDSCAMLVLVRRLSERLGLGRLHVLHVHHGLRGADADADARFVEALCERLGVSCTVRRLDVGALAAEEHGNVENVGRRERYRLAGSLLDELCAEEGRAREDGRIVCAHTADDRAETFLMRAIVGTGPGGLASIRHRVGRVVRPLLDLGRADLRSYLEQTTEPVVTSDGSARWREDETNFDTRRFRAFVRHEMVPRAVERNPEFTRTLCRTMDLIADEDELLESRVDELERKLVREEGDAAMVDSSAFAGVPLPLRRRLVRRLAARRLPEGARVESRHIDLVARECATLGFSVTLPGGLIVRNESGALVFGAESCGSDDLVSGWLSLPGRWEGSPTRALVASVVAPPDDVHATRRDEAYVNVGDLERLWVRSLRPGDRMLPLGLSGRSKKLSDVLIDAKVPRHLRATVPVVCAGSSDDAPIVWLAGVCLDERFRLVDDMERCVHLVVESDALFA